MMSPKIKRLNLDVTVSENTQKLLAERKLARENKDYKKADELRDQITALGFEVKDK